MTGELVTYTNNITTSNLENKAGVSYTYGDSDHAHAVTSLSNGNAFSYDANGNMTGRTVNSSSYSLSYDAENHMTAAIMGFCNRI